MDSSNALDTLDEEKLRAVIAVLKEGGVAAFRLGELELSFEHEEPESPPAGFVKPSEQARTAAAQAEAATHDPYHRAFNGAKPSFPRVKKADE